MSGDALTQIDISKLVLDTTNTLCSNIINSIGSRIHTMLEKTIFIDSKILEEEPTNFLKIFGNSPTSGVLMLANSLLLAFTLYYCIRLIVSHFSGAEVESPGRFFLRILLAAILVNSSLEICKILLDGTQTITKFFFDLGEDILGIKDISISKMITSLNDASSTEFDVFTIDGILTSMLSISSFALLISFSLRYILVELLVLASPFAFLCISNKSTEGFLKSWYRSLLSLLLLQIIIAALLLIPFALIKENKDSIFNKMLLVGSISALLKSGQLVKEFLGRNRNTNQFSGWLIRYKINVWEVIMSKKYFFPLNYKYSAKFLGIIEYKLLLPIGIYGTILFFVIKILTLSILIKIILFIFFFLPVVLILNSQVNSEPFYTFIFSVIKHTINKKIYLYKRNIIFTNHTA